MQVQRHATAVSVEQHLRLHVYPLIGSRPIGAIRPSEIQAVVRQLQDRLSPSTVAVVYGRVVAVFKAAVRDRVLTFSPCVDVRLPSIAPHSTLQVLDTAEVLSLAEAMPPRYRALVLAGAGTGLRPGELFGLAVDRIDFLRRIIRVDQQLVRVPGGIELAPLKTPSSYRSLPLPQVVADTLSAHIGRWPANGQFRLLFTNERGTPVQQHPFAMAWRTAGTRAGTPSWATPHDLRHYYASVLIRSGASVKAIQARLGHASAKTTLDVYGHLFPDEEDRTRRAIDDELLATNADSARTQRVTTTRTPSSASISDQMS